MHEMDSTQLDNATGSLLYVIGDIRDSAWIYYPVSHGLFVSGNAQRLP